MSQNVPIIPVKTEGKSAPEVVDKIVSIFKSQGLTKRDYHEWKYRDPFYPFFIVEEREFFGEKGQFIYNHFNRLAVFAPFNGDSMQHMLLSFLEERFV
jgi:hypothetical protein